MRISVIIPAHNSEKTLPLTLASIRKPEGHDIEVIVVDDRSSDRTAEIARQYTDKVVILNRNSGPAIARDEGARMATGELLVFTDADVELAPGTIERILADLDRHPECPVVTGNLSVDSVADNFIGTYKNLYTHYTLQDSGPYVCVPYTSIVAIRTSIFWDVGAFADVFPNEDRILGISLTRKGHRILFDQGIQVRHHRSYGFREFLKVETQRCRNIALLHLETKLLGHGRMDEHVPSSFVGGVFLMAAAAAIVLLGATASPLLWWLLPLVLTAILWRLRPFFTFLRRNKGLGFAMRGFCFAVFDLGLCSLGAAWGVLSFLLGRRLIPA